LEEQKPFPEDALIWFTDGSRDDSGKGSGIFGLRPSRSLSFPLGKYATAFQTEIYAILQCACENIRRAYRNRRIIIFSDSQPALRALSGPKVISELVVECLNALSEPAGLNEVALVWVPGLCGIRGNEPADKLARQVSAMPLTDPEPVLGIPKCLAREAIRTWIMNLHHRTWKDLPGHRHGKLFVSGPCKKRAEDLLKLSRHQLRMVVAILTGHAPVRTHLRTTGLFKWDPACRFCRQEAETVQHIIRHCEGMARWRFNVFEDSVVEPKDISTASVKELCPLIRGTGLLNLCGTK
jgi:ribonuclease HI